MVLGNLRDIKKFQLHRLSELEEYNVTFNYEISQMVVSVQIPFSIDIKKLMQLRNDDKLLTTLLSYNITPTRILTDTLALEGIPIFVSSTNKDVFFIITDPSKGKILIVGANSELDAHFHLLELYETLKSIECLHPQPLFNMNHQDEIQKEKTTTKLYPMGSVLLEEEDSTGD